MAKKSKTAIEPDFLELENKLLSITEELETDILKYINPVNLIEEKNRFFKELHKGNKINPLFNYLPKNPLFAHFNINPEFDRILKELQAIEVEEQGFGVMINHKKNDSIKKMKFIKGIGSMNFTENSINVYGKPSKTLVKESLEILELKFETEPRSLTSEKAQKILQKNLIKKGIKWRVLLEENMSARASVLNYSQQMKLKKDELFSNDDLKMLELHEIQTHVYRYLNGKEQPYKLFINGTGRNWLIADEGLAVVNELIFGLGKGKIKEYAGRVVAIEFALEHSFFETFDYLRNYFDDNKAFDLTTRAKRGINNTEKPGAFTKDYFYLEGKNRVLNYLKQDGKIEDLYYGKISVEDTHILTEIPKLIKPKWLPNYGKKNIKKIIDKL